VTDVGNDIMYGYSAEQTLAWVEQAIVRLQSETDDIILTDLPLASVRRLSRSRFLLFRSIVVPWCRLGLSQLIDTAERVDAGLAALAASRRLTLCRLKADWYGIDPIHMRPGSWRSAWQEILGCGCESAPARRSTLEAVRLYFMRPERQWLAGVEQLTPQSGVALRLGARVWLF
jgi:hypothetical protein